MLGSIIAGESVPNGITEAQVAVDKAIFVELAKFELKGKVNISTDLTVDDIDIGEPARANGVCESADVDEGEVTSVNLDKLAEPLPAAGLEPELGPSSIDSLDILVYDETDEFPQGGKQ